MPETNDLKCSVVGCGNKVAGYVVGSTDTGSPNHDRVRLPAVNACWCKEHQQKLLIETSADPEQLRHLSSELEQA